MSGKDVERDVASEEGGLVGFINDLRSERDVLTARVRELERQGNTLLQDLSDTSMGKQAAQAENAKLREALRRIADNHMECLPDCIEGPPTCGCEKRIAQAALADPLEVNNWRSYDERMQAENAKLREAMNLAEHELVMGGGTTKPIINAAHILRAALADPFLPIGHPTC